MEKVWLLTMAMRVPFTTENPGDFKTMASAARLALGKDSNGRADSGKNGSRPSLGLEGGAKTERTGRGLAVGPESPKTVSSPTTGSVSSKSKWQESFTVLTVGFYQCGNIHVKN
jgi:hypothetical protein